MSPNAALGFFGGQLGPMEIGIIAVVMLLVFGNRIPQVMRSLGRGLTQFKKGLRDTQDEIKREIEQADESSKKGDDKPQ